MKLLVLGGGRFAGRHLVDAGLARGVEVTTFTRGRLPDLWSGAVTRLTGDRDPAIAPGLAALEGGRWDAVIDTCGYVPRVVRASAQMLADRVDRYLFVSSISAYADTARPGLDETARLGELEDPISEEVGKYYGPLKVACERAVEEVFGARAVIVRPGLIVGPHDPTDRFGYWVARFLHPRLLGERAPTAVVPSPRERPLQFIDARDLATFMLDLLKLQASGAFNATSPAGRWSFGNVVDALRMAAGFRAPDVAWIDEATLLERKVEPWTGLPMWIPQSFTDQAGMLQIDTGKAVAAGLAMRPLADIIVATGDWLAQRDNQNAWKVTLTADAERDVLAAAAR
jgi:nucleoside-diphosphate-sugar epimerase